MIKRLQKKNLDKLLKPIKSYQIKKNEKTTIYMALMGPKLEASIILIFPMLIASLKIFLRVLASMMRRINNFLEVSLGGAKVAREGLGLEKWVQCSTMTFLKVLVVGEWETTSLIHHPHLEMVQVYPSR